MGYLGFKPAEQAVQIGADTILSSHIDDGVIVNADINASASIAVSKTALTAGAGLTLSTNSLSVDADQSGQITQVGTLTSLTGGTGDFNWDSGTLLVDSSANAVGIGCSPSYPLQVQGIIASSDSTGIFRLISTAGGTTTLDFKNDASVFKIRDVDDGKEMYHVKSSASGYHKWYINDVEKMTLDSSGNATLAGTITAQGTSQISRSMTSTTDPTSCIVLSLQNTSDTDNAYNTLMFKDAQGNDASCVSGRHDDHSGNKGSLHFFSRNGGSLFETFSLGNDGNAIFTGHVELADNKYITIGADMDEGYDVARTKIRMAPPKHTGAEWDISTFDSSSAAYMYFGYNSSVNSTAKVFSLDHVGNGLFSGNLTVMSALTIQGTAGIDLANGGSISSQDSGSGSIKLFGGGTNKGGYINLRGGGNSGDMRVYTGTSGDGALALTIDSSQKATFSDKIEFSGAITQSGAGNGKFVRKIHQANGTFGGDLIIYFTSTSWKSVIYDVTIAGHGGNGHWHGMFYWNGSGGDHNRSVAHYSGGVADLGLGTYAGGSGGQGFKLQADLTSVTHPIIIVELTAGGGDTIPESDISINLS